MCWGFFYVFFQYEALEGDIIFSGWILAIILDPPFFFFHLQDNEYKVFLLSFKKQVVKTDQSSSLLKLHVELYITVGKILIQVPNKKKKNGYFCFWDTCKYVL